MRLFAYGGTGYVERRRIGAWGEVPRGALESTYGMPGEAMIYGLGLLEGQPCLILRQRQTNEIGRTYAFSLLLDPGAAVWERFGWNAAAMIVALLDAPENETLLRAPETLTTDALQDLLQKLRPAQPEGVPALGPDALNDDFLAVWVGAAMSDAPTVAMPLSLDIERPEPAVLAQRLAALPPCFRSGAGWLIGGSEENARSFGAQLVLDDGYKDDSPITERAKQGRDVMEAWRKLAAAPEQTSLLDKLGPVPLWQWAVDAANSFHLLGQRLQWLGDLADANEAQATDWLPRLSPFLAGSDFLANEIQRALYKRLRQRKKPFSYQETKDWLNLQNTHAWPLETDNIALLEPKALAETLIKRNLTPDEPPANRCPPDVRCRVWKHYLANVAESEMPELFRRAADNLNPGATVEEASQPHISQILNIIGQRLAQSSASLEPWCAFPQEHWSYGYYLRNQLSHTALSHVQTRQAGWQQDYLAFANDDGGVLLLRALRGEAVAHWSPDNFGLVASAPPTPFTTGQPDLINVVNKALQQMKQAGPVAANARRWLESLAGSQEVRKILSTSVKKDLAEALAQQAPDNPWRNFYLVWKLFCGDVIAVPQQIKTDERQVLLGELQEMAATFAAGAKQLPNLDGLCDLLGIIGLADAFPQVQTQFPVYAPAGSWLRGWRRIDLNRAAIETVQCLLRSDKPAPDDWYFPNFDRQRLENNLLFQLFFCVGPEYDERYRRRVKELLGPEPLRQILRSHVQAPINTGFKQKFEKTLLQRFAWHGDALGILFSCLPPQSNQHTIGRGKLVKALADHDGEGFARETSEAWRSYRAQGTITLYQKTLLEWLAGPAGKTYLSKVERYLRESGGDIKEFKDGLPVVKDLTPEDYAADAGASEPAPAPATTAAPTVFQAEKRSLRQRLQNAWQWLKDWRNDAPAEPQNNAPPTPETAPASAPSGIADAEANTAPAAAPPEIAVPATARAGEKISSG